MNIKSSFSILMLVLLPALAGCERASLELPVELTKFRPSIEVLTPALNDGDDFSFRLHSDRNFRIDGYKCEFKPQNLNTGDEVEVPYDGNVTYTCSSVIVDADHGGTVTVALYDSVTGETVELTGNYMAYAHRIIYPSGITFSRDSLSVSYYDETSPESGIECFQVGMTPENSETGFKVEVVPGCMGRTEIASQRDGTYSQSCIIAQNSGTVYVKGGNTGGPVTIKVTATANTAVWAYMEVYVRHRVALMVYGSFREQMWDPGHTNGMSTGWYGVPSEILCRLVCWSISDDSIRSIEDVKADKIDCLQLRNFTEFSGSYAAVFRLSVSPEERTSDLFYGPAGGDCSHLVINYYPQTVATLPQSGQQTFSSEDNPYNEEHSLGELCSALTEINDNCHWVGYWWFLNIRGYRHETEWTDVALTVESIDYDNSRLDLRYCLYMFSTSYSSGRYCGSETYWWASADHVPWIQRWQN